MNNKPHILKPSKVRPFPTVFYFLDTETTLTDIGHKTKVHNLKIGICQRYDRKGDFQIVMKDEKFIRTKSDFIDWFDNQQKQKSHVYIIAHNIIYDATILDIFREFPKIGYKLKSIYSKGQTCIIRWQRGSTKITMLDNGNIFAGSLDKWGKIFGIPKMEIDFDTCTDNELKIYCKRDVEIMVRSWQAWIKFIHENECGGFHETIGSTAFDAWRHKYLKKEIYVHKEQEVLRLERDAYHGGRVEAFYQGMLWTDHYYYLDINNMYGHIMKEYHYPTGLQGYSNKLSTKRMISYLSRYSIVARVTVDVDEPAFIAKVDGHAAYPLGRYDTTLTTHEIEYALNNGWLEKVHGFAWYKNAYLFGDYIEDYYKLRMKYRRAGNNGYEAICKLLINSLYGKFGQTGLDQKIIGTSNPDEIWHMPIINAQSGKRGYQTSLGGSIYETIQDGESYHSMPVIAAHVTANARLYLLSLINKAGRENVFYCDTDSLIVNKMGYYNLESLINENEIGKLKVETQSPWLIVNAPKDYEMSERKKIKGIRNNAIELSDGIYQQEQWVKLAGLIRQGFQQGYTSKEIIKQQQRIIYSGVVTVTGKIEPFHL